MFTGIIEAVGHVHALHARGEDLSLDIAAGGLAMTDVSLGDSIAVNGVCLTVTAFTADRFSADVSCETLRHSRLAQLVPGEAVNLEKALPLNGRLGGHLVSGHVDGLGEVLERRDEGRAVRFRVRAPKAIARYIATRGSIAIDGVSLTVNDVAGQDFWLNVVPHSLQGTILQHYGPGRPVHLEVDAIARYVERLLGRAEASAPASMTEAFLAEHGFWK